MKHLLLLVVALTVGGILGRWLHIQRGLNRLGEQARCRMGAASATSPDGGEAKQAQAGDSTEGQGLSGEAPTQLYQASPDSISAEPSPRRLNDGFWVCSILFCVAPLALFGALIEGLTGQWHTLGLKAAVDGLAVMAFIKQFGPGVWLSIVPVVTMQGTLAMLARLGAPYLQAHGMLNPLVATCGLLVFCVALLVLGVHRVRWGDYLPALLLAPLLGRLFG